MEEYNKISSCKSAKEIWDKLEIANEGTNQVKEDNINMLVHDYELFEMSPNESLTSMYDRFLMLTNTLNGLGKIYSNHDMIRKVLRVLPKKWRPKVTAIQEAKDLHKLGLDELIGSLKTHEKELTREERMERESKSKKIFALEASKEEDDGDNDIALLSRKFMKFLAKKKLSQGKFNNFSSKKFNDKLTSSRSDDEDPKERRCFKCHKKGHFESHCPEKRKNKIYKEIKNALKEACSDSDEEDSDSESNDEGNANLCLTAIDNEVEELHKDFDECIIRRELG